MTKEELLEKLEEAAKPGSDLGVFMGWFIGLWPEYKVDSDSLSLLVWDIAYDLYVGVGERAGTGCFDLTSCQRDQIRERLHEYAHRLRNI